MLDSVLQLFDIQPDFDLNIMKHGQTITDITSRVLYGAKEIFEQEKRIWFWYMEIRQQLLRRHWRHFMKKFRLGHVEAGLRTGNMYSPYPERR